MYLRVSQGVRYSYCEWKEKIRSWVYERVVDLLYDNDSYVYLNAINVLAELAYADTEYLRKLVELQMEWRKKCVAEEEMEKEKKETKVGLLRQ